MICLIFTQSLGSQGYHAVIAFETVAHSGWEKLLYNLFLHCCAAVGKILTDTFRYRVAYFKSFSCFQVIMNICVEHALTDVYMK